MAGQCVVNHYNQERGNVVPEIFLRVNSNGNAYGGFRVNEFGGMDFKWAAMY